MSCSFLIPIIFHEMVQNVALNVRPYSLSSVLPNRGGVLPWTILGVALIGFHFFSYSHRPFWKCLPVLGLFNVLGLGPWPNIYIDMGSLTFHHYNTNSNNFRIWHFPSCLATLTKIDIKEIKKLNICKFTKLNLNHLDFLTSSKYIYIYIYKVIKLIG